MKTVLIALSVFIGSLLSAAEASKADEIPLAKQRSVEEGLRPTILLAGDANMRMNILERMKTYQVPGVSLAVVNEGRIEWAHGYGHFSTDPNSSSVDEHTLFQAGSISKPITALGALILVQQGKISLDNDVNLYLKRWKVPENDFTKTEKVTLRRLLSHTAGINVSGFPGYTVTATIPTIVEILEGKKPLVNTDPVTVILKPGTELKYSGGGTTIVQLLIEDVTGERFDVWMQNNVLNPLGMSESTFMQPLPSSYALHTTYGYHLNGVPVEVHWHIYPEKGAAGLWTTAKDLARFIVFIQTGLKSNQTTPLNAYNVKEIITRQKIGDKEGDSGLGVFLDNQSTDLVFGHDGQNEGFIARLSGYALGGQGVVIMMNNDSGWALMEEITNSVADAYSWPHHKPIEKEVVAIDPSSFTHYTGHYVGKENNLEVTIADSQLFIDFKNGVDAWRLFSSGKCTFFVQQANVTLEFLNCEGKPNSLTITDSKGVKTIYNKK